ncbi:MAG: two-component system, LytTR family, sensor kinase [Frankiales bacterium]|jgi:two-component system LytT family sensor kinase|nr:two-component system, LytTR family, sensor kinase [Frankiales bacterium]
MAQALLVILIAAVTVGLPVVVLFRIFVSRRHFGTAVERATYKTLHTASLAAPPLRSGLGVSAAEKAAGHLRQLLGSRAVAVTDLDQTLAWEGGGAHHSGRALVVASRAMDNGRVTVVTDTVACIDPDCPIRIAVVAPLVVAGEVVGSLASYGDGISSALVRATREVARWVSSQLELSELDESRAMVAEAELRALRAQISPHFVYNSLTAIASFVRTDPEQARELLLEFAEFTRYSFRRHGEFTTLAEELRSIDRYLVLERARFGDRLGVTLRVAPEVLPVVVPFLCLQPLVENAVRHGLEGKEGTGHVTITAEDAGNDAVICIEDDGVGMDPEKLRLVLAHGSGGDPADASGGIGIGNVDERLRRSFGPEYGLVVETGVDAGTRVTVRLPKYAEGVRAG